MLEGGDRFIPFPRVKIETKTVKKDIKKKETREIIKGG